MAGPFQLWKGAGIANHNRKPMEGSIKQPDFIFKGSFWLPLEGEFIQ